MPSISVSTAQELEDAYELLSTTPGGGEILLTQQADGLAIILNDMGGSEPVSIRSEDPDDPVNISQIMLRDVDNIKVSHLTLDSTDVDRPAWMSDILIQDSDGIEISDMVFTSNASGFYDPDDPDAILGERLGGARESTNVTFSNNEVSGYLHGFYAINIQGLEISGNTFTEMQGDGLRMGGIQDAVISGNYMHDFYGADTGFNHADMIQIWSSDVDLTTRNVTISDNILHAGNGVASQSIFIRNEAYDTGELGAELYENIVITNNQIYNGNSHGITVTDTDGLVVEGNTLLWNQDSASYGGQSGEPVSNWPAIYISRNENVTVSDNITARLVVSDDVEAYNNLIISYTDTSSEAYVDNHIINAFDGDAATFDDLRLRPDSPWADSNVGAHGSQTLTINPDGITPIILGDVANEDLGLVTFNAEFSVGPDGFLSETDYVFEWTFPDGTTAQGIEVTHHFDTHGEQDVSLTILQEGVVMAQSTLEVSIADAEFVNIDFEGGFQDLSSYDTELDVGDASLAPSDTGTGVRIGGDTHFALERGNDHYHNLESFGLSLDIATEEGGEGRFLQFSGVMHGWIMEDGNISFMFDTNNGRVTIETEGLSLNDGETHTIAIGYSNAASTLVLQVDGEVVAEVAANGTTAAQSSHELTFGGLHTPAVEAVIDNIYFTADPSNVGITIEGESATDEELVVPEPEGSPKTEEIGPLILPTLQDMLAVRGASAPEHVSGSEELDPFATPAEDATQQDEITPEPEPELAVDAEVEIEPEAATVSDVEHAVTPASEPEEDAVVEQAVGAAVYFEVEIEIEDTIAPGPASGASRELETAPEETPIDVIESDSLGTSSTPLFETGTSGFQDMMSANSQTPVNSVGPAYDTFAMDENWSTQADAGLEMELSDALSLPIIHDYGSNNVGDLQTDYGDSSFAQMPLFDIFF